MAIKITTKPALKRSADRFQRSLLCPFRRLLALIALACLFLSPLLVSADPLPTAPDAGQILQQIERDLDIKPAPTQPVLPSEPAPAEDAAVDKVTIKQFKFKGNRVLGESDLQEAVAPLTNRSISIAELKTCTDLVSALYRKKGYLASCTLPEQDITEGVVQIDIVEAVFGGVKFDGLYKRNFIRVKPAVIERYIEAAAPKGVVLNQDKLDQGMLLLEGLAGIKVESTLQAGQTDGTTDLLLKVKDQPLVSSQITLDNSGGRQTGREKLTAMLSLASPFGWGDTVNLTALHSQGTDYARLAYSLPVGKARFMARRTAH